MSWVRPRIWIYVTKKKITCLENYVYTTVATFLHTALKLVPYSELNANKRSTCAADSRNTLTVSRHEWQRVALFLFIHLYSFALCWKVFTVFMTDDGFKDNLFMEDFVNHWTGRNVYYYTAVNHWFQIHHAYFPSHAHSIFLSVIEIWCTDELLSLEKLYIFWGGV